MIRKMLTAAIAVTALLLSAMSLGANAQGDTCSYADAQITGAAACAPAAAYPGPFTNMPAAPSGPYGWGSLNPAATVGATPLATAGGTGGGLAHTGSESAVLGYVGAGFIAFGAVALGSRRKFFQGALD